VKFSNWFLAATLLVVSGGSALADFALGAYFQATRAVQYGVMGMRMWETGFFAQDDWRVTPRLTLSYGLRHEMQSPPYEVNNQWTNFNVRNGQWSQAGVNGNSRTVRNLFTGGFAPRLGIAWNPRGNTTLRAAAGRMYAQDTGNPVYDMARNLTGTDLFIHNQQLVNSYMGSPWANEAASTSCGGYTGTCLVGSAMYADQYTRRTPYVDEWTVDFQQPVARDLLLEIGYIGSEGHFLQRLTNLNQPVLRTGLNDARTIAQRQPWPAYGRFNYDNGIVNSSYNGFSAKLTRRLTNGLTMLAGFTWSHSLDDGSEIRSTGPTTLPTNTYNLKAENYGSSEFDQRKRFVASAVYQLPVGKGQMFLNHGGLLDGVIGGWQLGSILTVMDGMPTTVAEIGDLASLNQNGNYPNATGISPFPSRPTPQQFWNIAAFDTTNPDLYYTIGNTGINTLLTPHTRNWDFSATKNFRFHERHNVQFRFEAFNLSNHPNWKTPSTNPLVPSSFGVITAANPMRQLQFALKYSF